MRAYCPIAEVPGKAKTAPSFRKEPSRWPREALREAFSAY